MLFTYMTFHKFYYVIIPSSLNFIYIVMSQWTNTNTLNPLLYPQVFFNDGIMRFPLPFVLFFLATFYLKEIGAVQEEVHSPFSVVLVE